MVPKCSTAWEPLVKVSGYTGSFNSTEEFLFLNLSADGLVQILKKKTLEFMLGEDMGIYAVVFIMLLLPWPSRRERRKTEERRGESGQSVLPSGERPYQC